MKREEIKEMIRKCDAYIEDMEKFKQALETVDDLSTLTPEVLDKWKEQMQAAMPGSPLTEAILNLIPEVE